MITCRKRRVVEDRAEATYCVSDVIDHNGRLSSSVIHGCQAVIPLLASCVPDFKLYRCIVQTDRLCEEGSCKGVGGGVKTSNKMN